MKFLRLFPVYLLLTFLANLSSAAPASTPELSVLTFNPAKNSKTMPVENNIDITYGSTIKKGEGVITLKDSAGNTVESYQAGSSSNISIAGSVLSINPTAILASDKTYSINIPVGAVQDTSGNNFEEVIEYEFKTQIDVAFMLMGYNGTTLYETTDSFNAAAELATTQMRLLSFNRLNSYRTHMLPISTRDGEKVQATVEIEVIDTALDNWGPDNAFTNFYAENKTNPKALRNPTAEEISVLKSLRQWLVENEKGAGNWKDTDLGKEHYEWISEKVMNFCSPAARGMFDGVRMPAGFDVKEYRVISIILSSEDSYWLGAMASSMGSWGANHWNIYNSEGVKYTDWQPFFFNDHSDSTSGDADSEKIKIANAQVDVHEYIHTQGGEHDDMKNAGTEIGSCVSPYSIMSPCDVGDFFTYPIYNRIYITGWLPETAVTTDPSLIQDSYNATDPSKKYLLSLGNFRYQELFNGTWYQYSVRSFEKLMNQCYDKGRRPNGTVIGAGWHPWEDGKTIDPLYTCGLLVVDPACIVTGPDPVPGLNGEVVTGRNFSNCEFIDIETELSRGLFLKFLGRMDGSINDYSGSIDRNALQMEQFDLAARLAAVAPLDSDGDGVEDDLDASPLDASESVDSDLDGVGDNADAFPLDNSESVDSDGDGVGDNADVFPLDASKFLQPPPVMEEGPEDDSESVDYHKRQQDASESFDSDGDGVGDSAPVLEEGPDALPLDASESVDSDGDGVGDSAPVLEEGPLNGDALPLDANDDQVLATQFLQTTSTSQNITNLHILNSAEIAQTFKGTLWDRDGNQLGSGSVNLGAAVPSTGRLILSSADLDALFGEAPWSGPAMLQVQGVSSFDLMSKLISPSGLVSNTNCVREDRVLNIEGFESSNMTYVRLINTENQDTGEIIGTLYDAEGNVVGSANSVLAANLGPHQQVWINRNELANKVGAQWNGESLLEVNQIAGLKLLNLNYITDEKTFFNFSCFEDSTSGRVYLQTTSTSQNVSATHLVNTSDVEQQFTGTLYGSDGSQVGSANQPLHSGTIPSKGRVIISSENIESAFNISPWSGPAMLEVNGTESFELMTKLTSPSGLISNTNCVRQDQVHNIGGFDQTDMTYLRFINIGDTPISNIRGSMYDTSGNVVGQTNPVLIDELPAKAQVWRNRNQLSDLIGDTWNGTASLKIDNADSNLRLLNLNFINSETFFNFSCYETGQ